MSAEYVRVRGATSDLSTIVECTKCAVYLRIPCNAKAPRVEALIIGFGVDHAVCGAPSK